MSALAQLLADIEARAAKAHEGPWRVDPETKDMAASVETDQKTICISAAYYDESDFVFIAAARSDVPALVALAREQDAALRVCVEALGLLVKRQSWFLSITEGQLYSGHEKTAMDELGMGTDALAAAAKLDAAGILGGTI